MYSPRTVGGGALTGTLAVTGASGAPLSAIAIVAGGSVLFGVFCMLRTRLLRGPAIESGGTQSPHQP